MQRTLNQSQGKTNTKEIGRGSWEDEAEFVGLWRKVKVPCVNSKVVPWGHRKR